MLENLSSNKIPKSNVVLFPNWIDSKTVFPLSKPSPYRKELHLSDDMIVALYSGNMGAKQGLEVIIETARLLQEDSNLIFILCGDGVARKELEVLADGLSNLRFIPLQPSHRLNDLLNLADIHLLPQRKDAADLVMPSKLMGMMASGRPVIATAEEATQIAQILEKVGLLVPPENPEALAKAVTFLSNNRPLQEKFGSLGRSFVIEHWEKERILIEFHNRLQQLAG